MRTEPGDKPQSRLVAQPDRPAPDTIKLGEKPQYDPIAMPDLVLFLARYGKSRAQIAAHLGFSRKVLEDWEAATRSLPRRWRSARRWRLLGGKTGPGRHPSRLQGL